MLAGVRERRERAVREREFTRERSQPPTWRRMTPGGLVRPGERPGHLASTAHVQAAYPFVAQASLGSRGVLVGRNVYGGVFALDPWELYVAGLAARPEHARARAQGLRQERAVQDVGVPPARVRPADRGDRAQGRVRPGGRGDGRA